MKWLILSIKWWLEALSNFHSGGDQFIAAFGFFQYFSQSTNMQFYLTTPFINITRKLWLHLVFDMYIDPQMLLTRIRNSDLSNIVFR